MTHQFNLTDLPKQDQKCDPHCLYLPNCQLSSFQISCAICFTIYQKPRKLPCGHIYCTDCIQGWAQNYQKTCPLCRKLIKKTRGFYGRCQTKLSRIIEKLKIKCRNCCWEGTNCQFKQKYKVGAYIEQFKQQLICEQKHAQLDQNTIMLQTRMNENQKNIDNQNSQQKIEVEIKRQSQQEINIQEIALNIQENALNIQENALNIQENAEDLQFNIFDLTA